MPVSEHWHSPTVLSDQEMLRMQRDAEQRVRRMQQQANETIRQAVGGFPQVPPPSLPRTPPQSTRAAGQDFRPPHPPSSEGNSPLIAAIQALFQDQDRLLIAALLILLKAEKTDLPLLLAIGYLLL